MFALAAAPAAAAPPEEPPTAVPVETEPLDGPASDTRGFEAGFAAGQALFDRGQYLPAARTWAETAALLREGPDDRDNRAALFEYIADAYAQAFTGDVPRPQLEEALAVIDHYIAELAAAYGPDAPVGARVAATRDALRARLAPPAAPPPAAEGPRPAPPVRDRPTVPAGARGLAVGGGLGLGLGLAGLALFTAGAAQAKNLERRFDDPSRGCDLAAPGGECGEILRAGRAAQTQAIVGAVVGSVGLVTGAALLAVAHRRRATARLAPRVGPGFAGLTLGGRF